MKVIGFATAGLVAAIALTPAPAAAQRHGYGYDRYHHDYGRDRYRGGYGWRDSRSRYRHSYVRCHYVRGYYGRQRQCYRVYR